MFWGLACVCCFSFALIAYLPKLQLYLISISSVFWYFTGVVVLLVVMAASGAVLGDAAESQSNDAAKNAHDRDSKLPDSPVPGPVSPPCTTPTADGNDRDA